MNKVIIVGGGAAGMLAGIIAARNGCQVVLYEKNEKLGKKIFITGKGRCNVTNNCDPEELLQALKSNNKFLYSAFYSFNSQDMMALLEEAGVPLKTERGNRVFPLSDHSSDIIRGLERLLHRYDVHIRLRKEVQEILIEDGRTGHTVTDCMPSLVPLTVSEDYIGEMAGLSLRNVELTIRNGKKILYQDFGEMMFTHKGITGPLVLSASSSIGKQLKKQGTLEGYIDLKPALSSEQLDERILREFENAKNKQFKNVIGVLFPSSLTPVIIRLGGIPEDKVIHEISREERLNFVSIIKAFPFTIDGLGGYSEAVITKGGISVKEINPGTMESKKIPQLYFAGEVLDLDAVTGGYNLQIAWSTGYLAGMAVSENI